MERIIEAKRSVIVSADVSGFDELQMLLEGILGIPGIGAIKVGSLLGLRNLEFSIELIKNMMGPNFPVIYDHQKGGTDIPDMGAPFTRLLKGYGVDAVILFPLTGPRTQAVWTEACFNEGLAVLMGGMMTHPQFLVSEGGYIDDDAPRKIYQFACESGVRHFVVPGTKIEWVRRIRGWILEELGEGKFVLYAPGFVSQGGDITECGRAAGEEFHAIAGRAIYEQPTVEKMHEAALTAVRSLTS